MPRVELGLVVFPILWIGRAHQMMTRSLYSFVPSIGDDLAVESRRKISNLSFTRALCAPKIALAGSVVIKRN